MFNKKITKYVALSFVSIITIGSLAGCGCSNKVVANEETSIQEEKTTAEVETLAYEIINEVVYATCDTTLYKDIVTTPDTGEVIANITSGTQLTKVGITKGWSVIDYNGTMLFVSNEYLTSEVPTVAEVVTEPEPETQAEVVTQAAKNTNTNSSPTPNSSTTTTTTNSTVVTEPAVSTTGNANYMAEAESLVNANYNLVMQHINYVNQVRAGVGAAPLSYDRTLCLIATYRTIEMRNEGYFSHYGLDGSDRMIIVGTIYKVNGKSLGENITKSATDKTNANIKLTDDYFITTGSVDNFISSPGHYANMINTRYSKIGIGCVVYAGNYGHNTSCLSQVFQ